MTGTIANSWGGNCRSNDINLDSPDEMAFGQLYAPISVVRSTSYAESSGRILTDPTGERRNRQFRQHFRGLRSCQPNPSGESGIYTIIVHMMVDIPERYRTEVPANLGEAGFWSVLTCILHTTAAGIATFLTIGKIKRLKADRRPLAWENALSLRKTLKNSA